MCASIKTIVQIKVVRVRVCVCVCVHARKEKEERKSISVVNIAARAAYFRHDRRSIQH